MAAAFVCIRCCVNYASESTFAMPRNWSYLPAMSTAVLELKEKVERLSPEERAELMLVLGEDSRSRRMPAADDALAALRKLQALGTFRDIKDPVAWQREMREERAPLPVR